MCVLTTWRGSAGLVIAGIILAAGCGGGGAGGRAGDAGADVVLESRGGDGEGVGPDDARGTEWKELPGPELPVDAEVGEPELPQDAETLSDAVEGAEGGPEVLDAPAEAVPDVPVEAMPDTPSDADADAAADATTDAVLDADCTLPDAVDFEVLVDDQDGHTLHGTIWSPLAGPAPLVLLVHGLGCTRDIWGPSHFNVIDTLRAAGFTVAAYDQRGHGQSRHLAFSLEQMARDIGRVIAYLDLEYGTGKAPWVDTTRPVGLMGHSLGAYMVTIATCQNLDYLGPQYSRIGVVLAGAAPDNLPEVKEWLDGKNGFNFLVSLIVVSLAAFQPPGDWSSWWTAWGQTGVGAYDEVTLDLYTAQNPIGYGHGDGVATLDNADFILVPYYVAHSLADMTIPAIPPISAPSHLYNDVTYNIGPLGIWIPVNANTGYNTISLAGHDIWMDKGVVDWAVEKLEEFL